MSTVRIWFPESMTPEQLHAMKRDSNFQQAIGYLSTWNINCDVNIYIDSDKNMTAHYSRDNGSNDAYYTIGGILAADGTYSFHS